MIHQQVLQYFKHHQTKALENLIALSKIPSVSFSGFDPIYLEEATDYIVNLLKKSSIPNVEILRIEGANPYIFAHYEKDPTLPTLLLYAHYDVQPPLRDELWESPAFTPTERNQRLFGRGTSDDKAGIIAHIATIEAWLATHGDLPINIKILFEGEEELGSPHMRKFLEKYHNKVKSDAMIVLDGSNFDVGIPAIGSSTRGNFVFEIEVSSIQGPVHSGFWGGPVPDPAMALAKLLASFTNEYEEIAVQGFKETLTPLSQEDKKALDSIPYTEKDLKIQSGMLEGVTICGHPQESLPQKLWKSPCVAITSMISGKRKGVGNVIMDSSWARVSVRLAPGQQSDKLPEIFEAHIKKHLTWNLPYTFHVESVAKAWKTDTSHPYFQAALEAQEKAFHHKPYIIGCGGTLPLMTLFEEFLGKIPILLLGIEDPYTKAHGENESQSIPDFYHAIETQIILFEKIAHIASGQTQKMCCGSCK